MSIKTWDFSFYRYNTKFDYKLIRRPGKKIMVFFSALRPASNKLAPFYNRLTWANDIDFSCLFISDPGLRPSNRGTWYQGNKDFFAAEKIALDIRSICEEFEFDLRRTVLYGSSQGGFGALAVAAYLPSSIVLAEAPQTLVRKYTSIQDTSAMAIDCYAAKNAEDIPQVFESRLDAALLLKNVNRIGKTKIIVRSGDRHHVDIHAHHLLNNSKSIELEIFNDGSNYGHVAIQKEKIVDSILELMQ